MLKLLNGIFGGFGELAIIGAIIAGLFAWWQVDRASLRHTNQELGRLQERAEIRRHDDEAVKKADEADAASRDPAVRGVRDPYAGAAVGSAD
jgi:hypothetical protein